MWIKKYCRKNTEEMRRIWQRCTVSPKNFQIGIRNFDFFFFGLDQWKKKVESYRDWLIQENLKMRSLDSLRPKVEDLEEMAGTFKALNVD